MEFHFLKYFRFLKDTSQFPQCCNIPFTNQSVHFRSTQHNSRSHAIPLHSASHIWLAYFQTKKIYYLFESRVRKPFSLPPQQLILSNYFRNKLSRGMSLTPLSLAKINRTITVSANILLQSCKHILKKLITTYQDILL